MASLELPTDREGQLALVARSLDPSKGGLLTTGDLQEIAVQTGVRVSHVMTEGARAEATTENPALARYKVDHLKWSADMKVKCTWEEVQKRLLDQDGQKLNLALALHEGGVMFGVDSAGKILFADAGEDVTDIKETTGLNYPDTREAVYFRKNDNGEKVPTGYEMFPYKKPYEKSPEILAFEAFTGHPFVKSKDGKEWRSSWLESGETPGWPRGAAFFLPGTRTVGVNDVGPQRGDPGRGVRRLLRV